MACSQMEVNRNFGGYVTSILRANKQSFACCLFRVGFLLDWPSLWSNGQSSWLQIQRSGFDSRRYQIFWEVVGLERGPVSLMSTIEELFGRKRSGSRLESLNYCRRGSATLTTRHLLSAKVGTNFADKQRWPVDSSHRVLFVLAWLTHLTLKIEGDMFSRNVTGLSQDWMTPCHRRQISLVKDLFEGACGNVVGWGPLLQVGRSQWGHWIFSIYLFIPTVLWPWCWFSLYQKWVSEIVSGE
jgi:hypothetical protein